MRRAAKVDDNHKDIVEAFRKMGAAVLDIHTIPNCCDVAITYRGVSVMVEIKDSAKPPSARKLTEGEVKFRDYWVAHGGKWALVESVEDAQGLIKSIAEKTV